MKKIKRITVAFLVILLVACQGNTPNQVIDRAVLNANLLYVNYGKTYFEQLENLKRFDQLKYYENNQTHPATYTQYLEKVTIPDIQGKIDKVKKLSVNNDNKKLIEASLHLFESCMDYYKNDYPEITKLYDQEQPKAVIETAISSFEEATLDEFYQLNDALNQEAKPYAEKHGVDLIIN
ncbi:MAG: hypothetical protein ACK5NB_03450 [Flavobacteriaceae bacterium]